MMLIIFTHDLFLKPKLSYKWSFTIFIYDAYLYLIVYLNFIIMFYYLFDSIIY